MLISSILASVSPTSDVGWGGGAPVGDQVASGVRVTQDTAMRTSAVFACVRLISETISSLPISIYRKTATGKEIINDHPLYNILHYAPNETQTAMERFEQQVAGLMLAGNSYDYKKISSRGDIESLQPIHYSNVKAKRDKGVMLYEIRNDQNQTEIYTSEEIHHVRGLSLDGISGISVIDYQKETIGMALAAQDYGAKFFANDATPRGILQHPTKFKDDESLNRFRMSWRQAQVGQNRHSTAVLEDGITYKEIGMTNEAAQFLETRKFTVTDIARIFRVPPHMIADLEHATFSNISDQSIEFVVYCIRPWVVRLEQAIKRDLIVEDDVFVKFNVDGLLRGDATSRYAAYASGITNGWLTRNEVREKEDLNPLDGLDEPLAQLNMGAGHAPIEPDDDEMDDEDAKNTARLDAMELSAAERVARKELKGGFDIAFCNQVLQVAIQDAETIMQLAKNLTLDESYIEARTAQIVAYLRGMRNV